MLSQDCFGRPTRLRPQGFQCKTRVSHRWPGSTARKCVASKFRAKVCILIVPSNYECVHSTGGKIISCYDQLIGANNVIKPQNDANHVCGQFYVLLRDKQLPIRHNQPITIFANTFAADCSRWSASEVMISPTYLLACNQATCGLFPGQ